MGETFLGGYNLTDAGGDLAATFCIIGHTASDIHSFLSLVTHHLSADSHQQAAHSVVSHKGKERKGERLLAVPYESHDTKLLGGESELDVEWSQVRSI